MLLRTEQFAGAGGIRLSASIAGGPDRPLVLLAHGGGQTRQTWRSTMAALDRAGFSSIALDLRGHGESDWADEAHYRLSDFAEDLLAVSDSLKSRPHLIGASLGGLAGMTAEGDLSPGSFASLTLVDVTPTMNARGVTKIVDFMSAHAAQGFASPEDAAEAISDYLPHRPRRGPSEGLKNYLRHCEDGRYRWHWDPGFLSQIEVRRMIDHARLHAAAENLTLPLHLIRGGASDLISREAADAFRRSLPHMAYTDVAGAGHMVVGDDNGVFSQSIVEFLRRQTKLAA